MSSQLRKRVGVYKPGSNALKDESLEELDTKSSKAFVPSTKSNKRISIFLITALSIIGFLLRYYKIGDQPHVVWDEAHFAKFGSFYNKHTFYHDVHPPLGKMLCGLSEHIVGYDAYKHWDYDFASGSLYPEDTNYWGMRLFQVLFSSSVVPMTGEIVRCLEFSVWTQFLITLMVTVESSFIVLGKFVLLDSFLMFFSTAVILCLVKVHVNRHREGDLPWITWMVLLGVNIGCVCSVKWVGLFVTAIAGVYTVLDLWCKTWKLYHKRIDASDYFASWGSRIICLIVLPLALYMAFFKIHFDLLYKPGEGSGSMNTLFQVNMPSTDMSAQPRYVQLNDHITIRSQGPNSQLLHSHVQIYPEGSRQHQVTVYGHKDHNNDWSLVKPRSLEGQVIDGYLKHNDRFRLHHVQTKGNLHSHEISSHVNGKHWEVSGYGDLNNGDIYDDWILEIVEQLHSPNKSYSELNEYNNEKWASSVHPISTTFKLRHAEMGCYLATTGASYPSWGFSQGEVVCLYPTEYIFPFLNMQTHWNIESVEKTSIDVDNEYTPPKSNFFKDFLQLQRSMAASNNALTPDPSKIDHIASSWWQWPLLSGGIKMSSWGSTDRRYYMFGNPFTVWLTTLMVPVMVVGCFISILLKWKRGTYLLAESSFWKVFMWVWMPILGYLFHYLPFVIMSRVTYFHHYMPALYFAIFMTGTYFEYVTINKSVAVKVLVFGPLYLMTLLSFLVFYPTCLGMSTGYGDFSYMNWFPSWEMAFYLPFSKSWDPLKRHLFSTIRFLFSSDLWRELLN